LTIKSRSKRALFNRINASNRINARPLDKLRGTIRNLAELVKGSHIFEAKKPRTQSLINLSAGEK